jgi:hypothetical protein
MAWLDVSWLRKKLMNSFISLKLYNCQTPTFVFYNVSVVQISSATLLINGVFYMRLNQL